jgi:H+/Cl- antiporter ClcA
MGSMVVSLIIYLQGTQILKVGIDSIARSIYASDNNNNINNNEFYPIINDQSNNNDNSRPLSAIEGTVTIVSTKQQQQEQEVSSLSSSPSSLSRNIIYNQSTRDPLSSSSSSLLPRSSSSRSTAAATVVTATATATSLIEVSPSLSPPPLSTTKTTPTTIGIVQEEQDNMIYNHAYNLQQQDSTTTIINDEDSDNYIHNIHQSKVKRSSSLSTSISSSISSPAQPFNFQLHLTRILAAVMTLGSGCSLGPEGPAVEIGGAWSRVMSGLFPTYINTLTIPSSMTKASIIEQQHLLLAGIAAGVAAGFNAPISGVFFALECGNRYLAQSTRSMNQHQQQLYRQQQQQQQQLLLTGGNPQTLENETVGDQPNLIQSINNNYYNNNDNNEEETINRPRADVAAMVTAATFAQLIARVGLSDQAHALRLTQNLGNLSIFDLPIYLGLGIVCGVLSVTFTAMKDQFTSWINLVSISEENREEIGNNPVTESMNFRLNPLKFPRYLFPLFAGIICGIVAVYYPQTLFVGYATLDELIEGNTNQVANLNLLIQLLFLKMILSALSLSSGLVGGVFAPSLFFGAVAGTIYFQVVDQLVAFGQMIATTYFSPSFLSSIDISFTLPGSPAFATVGAMAVLGSLFRAPLTATMLVFELTQQHEIVLPVLVTAGIAGLLAELWAHPRKLW